MRIRVTVGVGFITRDDGREAMLPTNFFLSDSDYRIPSEKGKR